jgi:hypothetical protein
MKSIFYAPWRRLLAVAIALLLTALINQASLSKAAAQSNEYQWKVYFSNRSAPTIAICKDFKYEIIVEVTLIHRQPVDDAGEEVYEVRIPQSLTVTADGEELGTLTPHYSTPVRNVRPARFIYKAENPGNESIEFYLVPGPEDRLNVLAEYLMTFKVRDCNYETEIIYNSVWDLGGLVTTATGIMEDVTVEADEDGQLHGEGMLIFNMAVSGFPVHCTANYSTVQIPATVSGEVGEDRLNLQFEFQEGQQTVAASCLFVSHTGTDENYYPSFLTLFNQPLSFPMEGGVAVHPSPANPPPGTIFVIVTPVEEEEASSDAGSHALAALSAWFAGWPGGLK